MTSLIDDQVKAFLILARGDVELGEDVFEGVVEDGPERYASVWASNGSRQSERLDFSQIQLTSTFTVHSVGTTPEQARWVAERITGQVLGVRPTIEGRSCWPIRHASSQPIQIDKDVTPPLWFGVDVFDLTSTPKREP